MASFGEVLQSFKDAEEAENVVAILDNKDLQNGLIAWKSVQVMFLPSEDCTLKNPHDQWKWLWGHVNYDISSFGNVAGVSAKDVGGLISRLMGLRLIYPDGTIHGTASVYLQALIKAKVNSIVKLRGSGKK